MPVTATELTFVSSLSPWDDLVHWGTLRLTTERTGNLEQAVYLLCRDIQRPHPLPASKYRIDGPPVTCVTCIARRQ